MTDDAPKTPHHRLRRYDLRLPVFKQGDDLAHHLKDDSDPRNAFEALASQYETAASMCRRMAGIAIECPGLEVDADTHHIGVRGPYERLDALVTEGLLDVPDCEESDALAVRDILLEQLWSQKDDGDRFSAEDIVRDFAKIDTDLVGLNPVWVREVFDGLVEEGCLRRVGDQYEVTPDED